MLEKSDCLVSAKRSNSVFTFESELFSKIPDVFWNLVYGSSFVSGVEKCISDHNPAIITIVQNIGQAIFLPIFSNVPSLLSKVFFCFGFLFFI